MHFIAGTIRTSNATGARTQMGRDERKQSSAEGEQEEGNGQVDGDKT